MIRECIHTCEGDYKNYRERADAAAMEADERIKQIMFSNIVHDLLTV